MRAGKTGCWRLEEELSGKHGVRVEALVFDIRDFKQCKSALKGKADLVSQVSILVNNAGLGRGAGPIHEGLVDNWEQMIDTNIKGSLYVTRLILPHMVKHNAGHVINIGSVAGRWTLPGECGLLRNKICGAGNHRRVAHGFNGKENPRDKY